MFIFELMRASEKGRISEKEWESVRERISEKEW